MQYIGSNIRFIFTKIKELLNSHNTDNSAHSELFKSWKRLRNPNNADIANALAATYKNGIGDVLVEVKDDTTFALEDIKLFFRPASFKLISANESYYEGIYITMDGTQGRYVAKTFADSEIMTPEGPTTISTPSELVLYPASSDAVLYTPQTLTEEQQAQARANIGALDVNVGTTPVDIDVTLFGRGENIVYVKDGWLRPCPTDADTELVKAYRSLAVQIGGQSTEPIPTAILATASGIYLLYQNGLTSANAKIMPTLLNENRYAIWTISTNNSKHYVSFSVYGVAYSHFCKYCVEDNALVDENFSRAIYSTSTGVGAQTNVKQFRMSAAPTEDMHIATKQYVDTAKTEAQQLGLTAATPGQIIKVKTVDEQGSPTAWEAVDDRLPKVSPSDAGKVLGVEQIGEFEYGYVITPMPTLRDFIPLGITNASPGQFAKVSFVDDFGNPTAWEAADIYEKPDTGIPKSDLAGDVQTSLAKADTAISYDSQTLTDAQKQQARQNIGAADENLGCNKYNIHVTTTSGTPGDFTYYTNNGEIRQPAEAVDSSILKAFLSLTLWPSAKDISESIAKRNSKQYKILYDANYIDSPCCLIKSPLESGENVLLSYHSSDNTVQVSGNGTDGYYNLTYDVANNALTHFYVANNISAVNGVVDQLVMSAAPTEDMHIATKQYVDNNINDKLPIYIKMVPGVNNNEVNAEDGTTASQILDYLGSGREVVLVYQGFTYYLSEQGRVDGTATLTSLSFAACAKNPSDVNPNGDNVLSRITYDFNTQKFTVTTEGRYINPIDGVVKSDLSADIQKTLTNANEITKTGVGLIRYIKMVDADTTGSGIVVPDNSDETYYTIKDYINSDYTVILLYKGVPYSLNYTKLVNNSISLYYFHAIVSSDPTSTVDTASEIKTVMAGNNLQFKVTTKPLYISATVSNNTLIIR